MAGINPTITINGVSSDTITGLLITELPPISKPLMRTQTEAIDGRDGDQTIELGFSAYDKPVKIALTYGYDVDAVIKFFNSKGVVTFSNEPDKYYNFAIFEQIDFEKLLRFKTAEVLMHVQPFKRSLTETELTFNITDNPQSVSVTNIGNYYSRPTIKITGLGAVNLSVNGAQMLAIELGETSQEIIIDCEAMNAYSATGVLLNRLVTGNYDNIKFGIGSNVVTVSGDVSKLKISNYSRWL